MTGRRLTFAGFSTSHAPAGRALLTCWHLIPVEGSGWRRDRAHHRSRRPQRANIRMRNITSTTTAVAMAAGCFSHTDSAFANILPNWSLLDVGRRADGAGRRATSMRDCAAR
eukprot:152129-Chlamydomonas_euryale.AAC.1